MSTISLKLENAAYTYMASSSWHSNDDEIYVGRSYEGNIIDDNFTARVSFNIDSTIANAINSLNKLSITLIISQDYSNPGYTTAYLMTSNLTANQAKKGTLSTSTAGFVATGSCGIKAGELQEYGTRVTYTFTNISLSAGTYYIYIVRNGTSYGGFTAFRTDGTALSSGATIDYLASYTITYKLGDGNSNLPTNQRKIEGTNLILSNIQPIKNNTSSSSNFTITGNANGGDPNSSKTATKVITYTYAFSYWSGSDGKTYVAGTAYTTDADLVLTAVFVQSGSFDTYSNNTLSGLIQPSRSTIINDTYRVSLNPNGGSCNTSYLDSYNKTAFSFKCWNDNANESGIEYSDSSEFYSNKTVYAKWNRSTTIDTINLPTPTRNGYDFLGWSADASAASGSIGSYTPSNDVTLYALWKAKGIVNVRIGGTNRQALVYVWTSGRFQQVAPHVYNKGFKIST